jgi:hypothetical protein
MTSELQTRHKRCASTIHIIYSNGNHYYDALIFQGSTWETKQMTLSIIGDRSTSAARPQIAQSSVDNAANETTHCSKRNIADSTHDSSPARKRLRSQPIITLPPACNEQLPANEASKDKLWANFQSINENARNVHMMIIKCRKF